MEPLPRIPQMSKKIKQKHLTEEQKKQLSEYRKRQKPGDVIEKKQQEWSYNKVVFGSAILLLCCGYIFLRKAMLPWGMETEEYIGKLSGLLPAFIFALFGMMTYRTKSRKLRIAFGITAVVMGITVSSKSLATAVVLCLFGLYILIRIVLSDRKRKLNRKEETELNKYIEI